MRFTLTVQQRALRCRCGRYLAWSTSQHAAYCRCMRPAEDCACAPTSDPAEGCHRVDFDQIAAPEGQDRECE
jgi:hypothetical protein